MIYQTIQLSEQFPDATLTLYLCDNSAELQADPRPAVIVCPGGGYYDLSEREAEPIVANYFAAGMNAFLLRYSVAELASDYRPLTEAALAVKYVREHAAEQNTGPHRIFICGFSAGGHLAASSGILWNMPRIRDAVGVTDGSAPEGINRPDGVILGYPVITAGEYTHRGSIKHVSGKSDYGQEEIDAFSLELHVDETTSPVFLFHTFEDSAVPVQNSLLLLNALAKHKVPAEAHIYPQGPHGIALANKQTWIHKEQYDIPHAQGWMDLSIRWIMDQF